MTLQDLMTADAANVFLKTDDFAEVVTVHRRNGDEDVVTALASVDNPMLRFSRGDVVVYPGEVKVASTVSLDSLEAITVNGRRYEIVGVPDVQEGMLVVQVERTERERTSSRKGGY